MRGVLSVRGRKGPNVRQFRESPNLSLTEANGADETKTKLHNKATENAKIRTRKSLFAAFVILL